MHTNRLVLYNANMRELWAFIKRNGLLLPLLLGVVIVAGVLVLLVLVGVRGQSGVQFRPLRPRQVLPMVGLAALLGTYLGIWLQQVSFKYTPAGIAQALLATSPLFVLPMAALLGDRISWRAVLGVLVAIGGIWLLIGSP
jgi:drug/metabolite transporter (DMT)-like permease